MCGVVSDVWRAPHSLGSFECAESVCAVVRDANMLCESTEVPERFGFCGVAFLCVCVCVALGGGCWKSTHTTDTH